MLKINQTQLKQEAIEVVGNTTYNVTINSTNEVITSIGINIFETTENENNEPIQTYIGGVSLNNGNISANFMGTADYVTHVSKVKEIFAELRRSQNDSNNKTD